MNEEKPVGKKGRIIGIWNSIPPSLRAPLIFALFWELLTYNGSRLITTGLVHHYIETAVDRFFPVLPWTVSVYLLCYFFWAANYILALRRDTDTAWRFLSGDFLAKGIGMLIFLLFPTTCTRPVIAGNGVFERILRFVYWIDAPDNLFPSFHCIASWYCWIAVRGNRRIPRGYRYFSLAFAVLICVSTLTTRQHVFIDTVSGLLLAEGTYRLAKPLGFDRLYRRAFERASAFFRSRFLRK